MAEQGTTGEVRKEGEGEGEQEQVVNPWEVSAGKGGIDYDKLVDQFGCQRIDGALVDRVARITGRPPHCFLRRGLFFAHRYEDISQDPAFPFRRLDEVLTNSGVLLFFLQRF